MLEAQLSEWRLSISKQFPLQRGLADRGLQLIRRATDYFLPQKFDGRFMESAAGGVRGPAAFHSRLPFAARYIQCFKLIARIS